MLYIKLWNNFVMFCLKIQFYLINFPTRLRHTKDERKKRRRSSLSMCHVCHWICCKMLFLFCLFMINTNRVSKSLSASTKRNYFVFCTHLTMFCLLFEKKCKIRETWDPVVENWRNKVLYLDEIRKEWSVDCYELKIFVPWIDVCR